MGLEGSAMIEKRSFHRVPFSTKTVLSHNDASHQGQLENISMRGALVRLDHGVYLPQGSKYNVKVYIDGEDTPLQLNAEVVCFTFAMAGIKFASYKADTEARLTKLMDELSADTDLVRAEHEGVRRRLADYLREE
jgi:hypothetical protein